jgi:cytochrome c2
MESWRKKEFIYWVVAAIITLLFLLAVFRYERKDVARQQRMMSSFMAGDPREGGRVFFDKGCGRCHAIAGVGGAEAKGKAQDLGKAPESNVSLNELATAMWNHAPEMWKQIQERKVDYPRMTEEQVTNLFAFLYTIRYADENGDVEHGRELFSGKGCIQCHSLQGRGGRLGPDLAQTKYVDVPFFWAQEMWNHAPHMEALIRDKNIPWPKFRDMEMVDLLSYVRSLNGGARRGFEVLPADLDRGRELFRKKGCLHCHAVDGEGGVIGPDLGRNQKLPRTLTQAAGWMWNHSPEMWRTMQTKGVERPVFEGQEMADLLAYLFSIHYFDEPGNPEGGKQVFRSKGCAACHGEHGEGSKGGPNIEKLKGKFSPVRMAYTMWQHGPSMYARAQREKIPWPKFQGSEMADLVAFMNSH